MRKIPVLFTILFLMTKISFASIIDTNYVYGLTIDDVGKLSKIITSLSSLYKKPTTRIVFDEWVAAKYYQNPVNQVHNVSFIMGEILDSYYMSVYNLQQFTERTQNYLDTLGDKVDIWEIGNEINGEWCGSTCDVIAKINAAYQIIKINNKKTAITLYYNRNCWSNPENEMFHWVNDNISQTLKSGLDYVWVSYYEDDCNGYQPNWQRVFDSLHAIFPNSKLGMGECGTNITDRKAVYINKYYKMNVTTPKFVGGDFWWYYRQDCVPQTDTLWTVFNNATSNNIVPSSQASNINCMAIVSASVSLCWNSGNGSKRVVFLKEASSGAPIVSDGTSYNASATYGLGSSDGTGWYCVYNGCGNGLTVTGLTPARSYRAMVFEYNGSPGLEGYNKKTTLNNPRTLQGPVIDTNTINTNAFVNNIKLKGETENEYNKNSSGEKTIGTPSKFELCQNYPNPFNPKTNINFGIPLHSKVSIQVYDISGRVVKTLLNEAKTAGYYSVAFDGSNISSGVYFYKIEADKYSEVKRMLLIK